MTQELALRVGAQQTQSRLIPSREAIAFWERLMAKRGDRAGIYEQYGCTVSVEDLCG